MITVIKIIIADKSDVKKVYLCNEKTRTFKNRLMMNAFKKRLRSMSVNCFKTDVNIHFNYIHLDKTEPFGNIVEDIKVVGKIKGLNSNNEVIDFIYDKETDSFKKEKVK
jgi:hypothetical protein